MHQVEIIEKTDPRDARDDMQEREERPEIAASQVRDVIEKENQERYTSAQRQRAVGFLEDLGNLFEEFGNGCVDVGHDKLLPRETTVAPRRRRESKIGTRQ